MAAAADPLAPRLTCYIPHVPHPPQQAFLLLSDLGVEEALYGGAAGGGKSDALLMAALQYADVPGYAALLLRKSYADLSLPSAIMDRAHEWLAPTDARWRDVDKTWTFPSGATLTFGYLQTSNDRFRYQSAEFQFIGFDELTQFGEADYRYLASRLRRPDEGPLSLVPLRLRGASNPGGSGHRWVKRRLIDQVPDPDDPGDTPERCRARVFIPARLADNPSIDRAAYESQLNVLDPQTRLQLLAGDWTARPQGDWVFPSGLDEVMALGAVLRAQRLADELRPPVGGHLSLAADWGVNSHVLLLWPLEGGGLYVAAEVVYHGDSVWEAAEPVARHVAELGWPVGDERFDSSMPGLNAAFLRELGPLLGRAPKWIAIPFNRWKSVGADYLRLLVANTKSGATSPVLAIDELACPVLAEQMRAMQYADPDAGRIEKGEDHGFDALVAGAAPEAGRRLKMRPPRAADTDQFQRPRAA